MRRYFFHRTDGEVDTDKVGTLLPSLDEARNAAVVYAGESIRDRPDLVWEGRDLRIEVSGEDGSLLFTIAIQAIDAPSPIAIQEAITKPS